jgi:hypothetical protein
MVFLFLSGCLKSGMSKDNKKDFGKMVADNKKEVLAETITPRYHW